MLHPTAQYGSDILTTSGLNLTNRDDEAAQRVDFLNKKTGNWFMYYVLDDSPELALAKCNRPAIRESDR